MKYAILKYKGHEVLICEVSEGFLEVKSAPSEFGLFNMTFTCVEEIIAEIAVNLEFLEWAANEREKAFSEEDIFLV